MPDFAAILLVCLASLPPEQCAEATAVEMRSTIVRNELGCTQGWQELIAHEPQAASGEPVYLKTACRRTKPQTGEASGDPAEAEPTRSAP